MRAIKKLVVEKDKSVTVKSVLLNPGAKLK
jgi:hypothetical protein